MSSYQINVTWVYTKSLSQWDISGGIGLMIADKYPSGTSGMTLIFQSRLIWIPGAATFTMINSHIATAHFCTLKWDCVISQNYVWECLWEDSGIYLCCPLPPEWDPSIRVSHHHSQTAHRGRRIWGKSVCVILLPVSFLVGGRHGICMCMCMCLCAFLSAE